MANREEQIGKGELDLPVREMLADMLRLDSRYGEALVQYQQSLKTDPNRFNALLGAGEAADLAGDRDMAERYYSSLLRNCPAASGPAVRDLDEARRALRR